MDWEKNTARKKAGLLKQQAGFPVYFDTINSYQCCSRVAIVKATNIDL